MLSILIPTIGRADTITRAINSALKVDSKLLSEVVVLDNSQDPDFGVFLSDFVSKTSDKRLNVACYDDRKSMSDSWNSGLDYINNDWVLYLHDDDELLDINEYAGSILKDLKSSSGVGFISYNYTLSMPFNIFKGSRLATVNRKESNNIKNKIISIINDCPKFVSTIINVTRLKEIGGWKAEYGYFLDLVAFIELCSNFDCQFNKQNIGIYYIHADNFSSVEKRNQGYGDYMPVVCGRVFDIQDDSLVRSEFLNMCLAFIYPKKRSFIRCFLSDIKGIVNQK